MVLGDCLIGKEFRLQKKYCKKEKSPTVGNSHQMRSLNNCSFLTSILGDFFYLSHFACSPNL